MREVEANRVVAMGHGFIWNLNNDPGFMEDELSVPPKFIPSKSICFIFSDGVCFLCLFLLE